jgi:hypothetical protein
LELADGVPEGSQLYFDNWFASPLLIKKFGEKNIGATCTLRQNRYGTVRVFSTFPKKTNFFPFFLTDRKLFFIKGEENTGRSVSQELEMCDD